MEDGPALDHPNNYRAQYDLAVIRTFSGVARLEKAGLLERKRDSPSQYSFVTEY